MSDTTTLITIQAAAVSEKTSTSLAAFCQPDGNAAAGRTLLGDERLIRLRQAIAEGAYRVDPRRIARKMLKRG